MCNRRLTSIEEKEHQGDEKQKFRFFSFVWDERTTRKDKRTDPVLCRICISLLTEPQKNGERERERKKEKNEQRPTRTDERQVAIGCCKEVNILEQLTKRNHSKAMKMNTRQVTAVLQDDEKSEEEEEKIIKKTTIVALFDQSFMENDASITEDTWR